jgi:hypothetical protein
VHDAARPWLAMDGKHVVGRFETDQEARAALRVRHEQKGEKGGLPIWYEAGPDDPMYKEGYRSYSPHWAQPFTSTKPPPSKSTKPRNARKSRRPARRTDRKAANT